MNPTGGNIRVRGKARGPQCSGMVSTPITQISTGTVHVLHGESKFALSENMDRAHVHEAGSGPSKHKQHAENRHKCTTAHPEPQCHEDQEKDNASIMTVISTVLWVGALAPETAG